MPKKAFVISARERVVVVLTDDGLDSETFEVEARYDAEDGTAATIATVLANSGWTVICP
jgi:hypothetical protein